MAAQPLAERGASTRRDVIKQRLRGKPERDIGLVEVSYPPGKGSAQRNFELQRARFIFQACLVR
jgi:hypothetical protein